MILSLAAVLATALAADNTDRDGARAPVLVELFTSQSCSSCPPAADVFAVLADDPALVTLEWHVDYWDTLVWGADGAWKDPYSNPAYTVRQRLYNQRLRGQPGGYTPQAIIAGASETVGARAATIRRQIANAPAATGTLNVTMDGSAKRVTARAAATTNVYLAIYEEAHRIDVLRGENAGRALTGRHTVQRWQLLGQAGPEARTFTLPTLGAGTGCAIILQDANAGAVHAARYCDTGR